MRRSRIKALIFAGTAVLLSGAYNAYGAPTQEELRQLERDIQSNKEKKSRLSIQSDSLKKEVASLRAELIALSQSVQQREANVTRLEISLAEITREEAQARVELEKNQGQSVETLMALQRLALNPPEALIALPQPPADMVRSAILLRSVVPQITEKAQQLRREVQAYAEKRQKLEDQKKRLDSASLDLEGERGRLRDLIEEKKRLSERYLNDSLEAEKNVTELSRKARDLRSLLEQIEKDKQKQAARRPQKKPTPPNKTTPEEEAEDNDSEIVLGQPPSSKPIAKARGSLARPSSGELVMQFGETEKLGGKHKGISFKTRRGAQVVATYDGQIAFAGPFRGYKQLLIIDHGGGYHTLLTGMERLDVSVGQWLLSGEPVGVMSQDGSKGDTLYFELRKNGAPINPLPWIRQRNAKAQG